jgi:nucleoside-triphosphatase
MGKAILLTGRPGCGKTTLIQRVITQLSIPAGGFYTQEIREPVLGSTVGVRKGFEILTLDGRRGVLSRVDIHSPVRIGKYGVNLHDLEHLAVRAIRDAITSGALVVIDEIGPMEITSSSFCQAVLEALESRSTVLGSIVQRSTPFTDQVKRLPQVTQIEVRPDNRQVLAGQILEWLSST